MRQERRNRALLTVVLAGLLSIFAIGCGSSDNGFVATGNSNPTNAPTAGNLIFRFVQAQQTGTVPIGTTTLRFDFFSEPTPSTASYLFTESRAYADLIIVRDVPPNVRSVTVTAFGPTGQPTAVLTGEVSVIVGGESNVDLVFNSNPTFDSLAVIPSPFSPAIVLSPSSNTAQVEVFGTFDSSVLLGQRTDFEVEIDPEECDFTFTEGESGQNPTANITTSGMLTGLNYGQNSTLNCQYTALGSQQVGTLLVRACELLASPNGSLTLFSNDTYTAGYTVDFADSDGTLIAVNSNSASNATFATSPSTIPGLEVDSATGDITTTGAAAGDYTLVVTWQDPRTQNADGTGGTNASFSTNLTITVIDNI